MPFATKAQVYTVVKDRTAADRQVDQLRRDNQIRLLQLPSSAAGGPGDYALVLTADYEAALRRSKHEVQSRKRSSSSDGGGGDPGGTAGAAEAALVFDWLAMRVLPACTEVMVTHSELLRLLAARPLQQ